MPPSYPELLDDATLATVAPALAALLREPDAPVRQGLDAAVRTLAAHAARMAQGPFGTAALHRAALDAPFDAGRSPIEADAEGAPTVFGCPLAEGSSRAIATFGVEPVARLASALARVLPLGTVSSARLPGVATAILLVGWAEGVRVRGLDAAALAALLIGAPPMRNASLLTLRIATAAGLPLAPRPFAGA